MIKIDIEAFLPELKTLLKKQFEDEARALSTRKISTLFARPDHVQHVKDRLSPGKKLDPDLGYAYRLVMDALDDKALTTKFEEYAKVYVEKHFQAALDTAIQHAIDHKARKIAFQTVANLTEKS